MHFLLAITIIIASNIPALFERSNWLLRTPKNKNNFANINRLSFHFVPYPSDPADEWLGSTRGTKSPHTERALRTDLDLYRIWCRQRGLRPWPVRATVLGRFIDSMAIEKAPATVQRHIASITALCRAVGWKNPHGSVTVTTALQRMNRHNGRRQVQVHGITWSLRKTMIAASGVRLINTRNCAMLAVAYDALLRRGELVSLQVSDLMMESDGSATLLVRRSKTDQEGEGAVLFLAEDSLKLVLAWLDGSGITDGFLFRSLRKNATIGEKLDPSQVPRIYKSMAKKAGLAEDVVAGLSGHSARVGAAQDMIASGIELPAILQAGRWKSTGMVNRYGERLLARRSGSAQLARLQHRTKNSF